MKVLFNTANTAFQTTGGGEILLLKLKEYLEKEGIYVKLFNQWEDDITKFDILHSFSMASNCYDLINLAHSKKVPVAISTLFWPSVKYALKVNFSFKEKIKGLVYEIINKYGLFNLSKVRLMLKKASILLPNSELESKLIQKTFKINPQKIFSVHNGVDERFYNATSDEFIEKYSMKDFILFIGRMEPRKNLLNLIKAVNQLEKNLIIIGSPNPQIPNYAEQCKKIARPNIHFLGEIPHNSSLLESAYAASKVLALPSWWETPGLVALEAGLAGANVVITPGGATREYYEDYVSYVNPNSVDDIKLKIKQEYDKEKTKELSNHIRNNLLWKHAAKKTLEGYNKILK